MTMLLGAGMPNSFDLRLVVKTISCQPKFLLSHQNIKTFQNYSELEIPGKRFTFAIGTAFQLISKVKLNTTTYGSFLEIDCLAIDV